MQVSGKECVVCKEKIFLQAEGTWCPSCQAGFHLDCWKENTACPQCNAMLEPPGKHFVRSALCPECGTASGVGLDSCTHCGAATCWDTQAKYQERKDRVNAYGRSQLRLSVLEFSASLLLLHFVFGIFSVALAFVALPDAVLRFRRARKAVAFR